VRANALPLSEIVEILLGITPVGLDMETKKNRLKDIVELTEATVVHRHIDVPTLTEHTPSLPHRVRQRMDNDILNMSPQVLVGTIDNVESCVGWQLNHEIRRNSSTHAVDPRDEQAHWTKVSPSVIPTSPTSMPRRWRWFSVSGLMPLLNDSWLSHLNVKIQNDIDFMAVLRVLDEHASEQGTGSP
jgi:hypothetical protein